jgi:hypothetical protein
MTVPWLVPVTRSANRMRQSQKVIIDNTFYGGPWTMCDDPETDPENISWNDSCVALSNPMLSAFASESPISPAILKMPICCAIQRIAGTWNDL